MLGNDWLALFGGVVVFFLCVPAFLILVRSGKNEFVTESINHEIESLMAVPPAVYREEDIERRGTMSQKDEQPMSEEGVRDSLIRLQERYNSQDEQLRRLERLIETGQQQQSQSLEKLATAFNNAFTKASEQYVTKQEFGTVKTIVYSAVGLILTGFIGGLLALVLK